MEAGFGHDFSQVRVHDDQRSAAAADDLGAAAYTAGSDIVFSAGSYQPDTAAGRWLVAHELAHVVQQADAPPPRRSETADPAMPAPHDPSEGAADAAAEAVLSGRSPATPSPVPAGTIQRSPADADGAAAPSAGMASRVVDGEGNYRYEQFANGDIVVVEGPARVGERHPKGDPVNKAITEQIELLHGPFPEARVPPAGGGGLLPSLGTILTTVRETLGGMVDTGVALIDDLTGLVRSAVGLVSGTSEPPTAPDAAGPVVSGTEVAANLTAAQTLAKDLGIGHLYDHDGQGKNGANETVIENRLKGDQQGPGPLRDAIIAGQADQLQTIICSEFTNLTLAKMGVDLAQRYLVPSDVPGERLPLGYPESGRVTFLTLYMVTNNQRETTPALIDHQNGNSDRVEAGSTEAIELGCEGEAGDFFVVAMRDMIHGLAVEPGDEFGAGATAVSLGGIPIEPADRKPGDLQQTLEVDGSGQTHGSGHSSQVWTVFGHGIARLGQGKGSPVVVGGAVSAPGPIETLSGWYALPKGDLKWAVGPETDPGLVATLTCVEYELIEANVKVHTGRANDDATGIGPKTVDKSNEVVSIGRLPDTKWISWKSREDQRVDGTLS